MYVSNCMNGCMWHAKEQVREKRQNLSSQGLGYLMVCLSALLDHQLSLVAAGKPHTHIQPLCFLRQYLSLFLPFPLLRAVHMTSPTSFIKSHIKKNAAVLMYDHVVDRNLNNSKSVMSPTFFQRHLETQQKW